MSSEKEIIEKQINLFEKGSDELVLKSLSDLRKNAKPEIIPSLIERWDQTNNEDLKAGLFGFMTDLKDQRSLDFLMNTIQNQDFPGNRAELISILWMSSLDSSEYLSELVEISLQGDYMTIVEVSTVIESYESVFLEDDVMELIYQVREAAEMESDENKAAILNSLAEVISRLPVE